MRLELKNERADTSVSQPVALEGLFGKIVVDVDEPRLRELWLRQPDGSLAPQNLLSLHPPAMHGWAVGGYSYVVGADGARYESHRCRGHRAACADGRLVLGGVKLVADGGQAAPLTEEWEFAITKDGALRWRVERRWESGFVGKFSGAPALFFNSRPNAIDTRTARGDNRNERPNLAGNGVVTSLWYEGDGLDGFWNADYFCTWNRWHEGVYYLYYLANVSDKWDNISLATSADGVHWQEHGPVLTKPHAAVWMGTGTTWKSPNFDSDGKFFMNYSLSQSGQRICMAESNDLVHWMPLGPETTTRPDPRWYKISDDDTARWDCIFTAPRGEGGLWGWWTACPIAHAGIGFGWSSDGVHWESLPPPVFEQPLEADLCEHGGVARVGDRYYHMVGVNGNMTTYVADNVQGPLRRAAINPVLLGNEGAWHTYFARFFHAPDGLLVNHHSIACDGMVCFGLLKRTVIDAAGTLRLGWWEGYDRLEVKSLEIALDSVVDTIAGINVRMLRGMIPTDSGIILKGRLELPAPSAADEPCGLFIGTAREEGTAILLAADGSARIGRLARKVHSFEPHIGINRMFDFGRVPAFRLVLKRNMLEFYLADILIHCYSLPAPCDGTLGLIGYGNKLCIWTE